MNKTILHSSRALIGAVLIILAFYNSKAQPNLRVVAIGGPGDEFGYSFIQTLDGGYAIAGSTTSYGAGGNDVYVVKLDAALNIQWTKTIGGAGNDVGNGIAQSADGSYIIAGATNSYGAGGDDVYLVKLASNGNLIWDKTYGGSGSEEGNAIVITNDGGYAVAGTTTSYGAGGQDIYFLKLDTAGNVQWTKTVGGTGNENGYSLVQTPDKGYAICGNTTSYLIGSAIDAYLVKLDSSGNVKWSKREGNPSGFNYEQSYCVINTSAGGLATVGNNRTQAHDPYGEYTLYNSSGNFFLNGGIGNYYSYPTELTSIAQSNTTKDFMLAGYAFDSLNYGFNATIIARIDSQGRYKWSRQFYTDLNSYGQKVIATADNGFAVLCYCNSFGNGGNDIVIYKFDSADNICHQYVSYGYINNIGRTIDSAATLGGTGGSISGSHQGQVNTGGILSKVCSSSLSIVTSETNMSCYGYDNGTGTVTANGGVLPYTYLWSPGSQTTATVTGLSNGTYTIVVTDLYGSTASATITITQPTALVSSGISTTIPGCNGGFGSATINTVTGGVPPYTYYWNDANSQTTITASLSAGSYTVSIIDNNGCGLEVPVTITQPALLAANVLSTVFPVCFGGTGTITAQLTFDTIIQTFSNEAAVQKFIVPAGVNVLTITASGGHGGGGNGGLGAIINASFPVTSGQVLSMAVGGQGTDASAYYYGSGGGGGSYVYDSNSYILFMVAAGGGGQSWQGNRGGAGGIDLIANSTTAGGGYYGSAAGGVGGVGGMAGNGGISDSTSAPGPGGAGWITNGVSVTGDFPSQGGNDRANYFAIATAGFAYGGYAGGGVGTYDCGGGGGGYNGGGGGIDDFSEAYSGGGGGGGSYLMPTATLIGSPVASEAGTGFVTIKYLHIGGVPPYLYSWSPAGGTNLTTSALSAGTYTLTVTDSNGCMATLSATITQPLKVLANPSVLSNVICNGGRDGNAVALPSQGVAPYTYLWSNGSTTNNDFSLSSGSYSVWVTDNNGCKDSASVVITSPTALVVSTGFSAITGSGCNGSAWVAASGATPPYKYLWTPGGATTDTINNLCPNNYCCTVTDSNGCTAISCVTLVTGINELVQANGQITIYPNPASTEFTVLFNGNVKGKIITVYNVTGQKIYEQQCNCQSAIISCQSFADGVYFMKVLMDDGSTMVKKMDVVK